MNYRCKTCDELVPEGGVAMRCPKCGGTDFDTTPTFQPSHDSDVYTDRGDDE